MNQIHRPKTLYILLAICIIWSAVLAWQDISQLRADLHANGTVVREREVQHIHGPGTNRYVLVRFQNAQSEDSLFWARNSSVPIGSEVPVIYNPADVKHARVYSSSIWYEGWTIPLFIAAWFLVVIKIGSLQKRQRENAGGNAIDSTL